jgi:hypothetical protein
MIALHVILSYQVPHVNTLATPPIVIAMGAANANS